ncbi:BamA/TamA family outer membrane protein [Fulvivirga ligni]|uniref:BamA/TamA family outer membrane protein n=1 Tax=Fulvivirga ligni TaxID=2904246 RepID=UPI001F41ADE6|nr:BamA/TamA family outer membrane protein [Fulvivirga ligni]UII22048.1 BamA/TamA family outer membrane protein [Fulvivirga ligni]
MKIAVVTCLLAERNMDVDTCHLRIIANLKFLVRITCLAGLILLSPQVFAQTYLINYYDLEQDSPYATQMVSDSILIAGNIKNELREKVYQGYLSAQISELNQQDSVVNVIIERGQIFEWARLSAGNVPETLLSKAGFRERFFSNKPFKIKELTRLFEGIIKQSENSGLPFASVMLDSLTIVGGSVESTLLYEAGPSITYDSLVVQGNVNVKDKWLANYLRLSYGKPFQQKNIDEIGKLISQLNFLILEKEPEITFQNDQARVILSLKHKKADYIDGVIGFLPNAQADGRLMVTGQFDLRLSNLFRSGKSFEVEWKRLKPESQLLDMSLQLPNILSTPLNVEFNFNLFKEDSTFINRSGLIGLNYSFRKNNIAFLNEFTSSRKLTSTDNSEIVPNLDLNYYGVVYRRSDPNISEVGKSALQLLFSGALGNKKVSQATLPGLVTSDSLNSESVQYKLQGMIHYSFPLTKYFKLNHKLSGAALINDHLYINDLFRVGGLKSLRGFNENNFYASSYFLSNVQLEWYFNYDSYLYLFYDQSVMRNKVSSMGLTAPLGAGLGLSLPTGNGRVNLAYAIGRSDEQPFSARLSKFHFGYVANF